jgi:hypothetical protein
MFQGTQLTAGSQAGVCACNTHLSSPDDCRVVSLVAVLPSTAARVTVV